MIKSINTYIYNKLINNHRFLFLFSILAIEIYLFPLYFYGQNAKIQIFDNLDITIPVLKVLTSSGMMFASSDAIIPNIMGGLPRLTYGSELNGYVWLHYFFTPFVAFTINETLMHFVAFMSMIVLLSRYFLPAHHRYRILIIYSVSLMFALLPFHPGAGLSVPSIPLALYAFLNIRSGVWRWYDWLIIILIPFYSSLILVYFFFLLVMSGMFVIDIVKNRKINFYFFAALALMSISFVIVEYRLFYDMFIQHLFVSHRTAFSSLQEHSLWETYKSAHGVFLNGSVDMDTRASAVILPFVLFVMILSLIKKRLSWQISILVISSFLILLSYPNILQHITGNKFAMPILIVITALLFVKNKLHHLFFGAILLQLFFSYWYALWFYQGTGELALTIPILKEFNFARIALLQPIVWAIIVSLGMVIAAKKLHFSAILFTGIVLFQMYVSLNVREFSAPNSAVNYRSYYAEDLFLKIKTTIGKDPSTYRVGCLAFDPAISVYNGLYTVDGYMTNYPLEYKHKFRKIIEQPLLDSDNKGNFDLFVGWGSKCYLFDGGESSLYFRKNITIKKLHLDMKAFYDLGGRYLLSAHRIEESQLKNLVFMREFRDKNTFWTIYLYRVDLSKP